MIVNVEEVRALKARLREINRVPIEQIEWHEGGQKLELDPDLVADWSFMGMNNADFIDTEYYKEDPEMLRKFLTQETT